MKKNKTRGSPLQRGGPRRIKTTTRKKRLRITKRRPTSKEINRLNTGSPEKRDHHRSLEMALLIIKLLVEVGLSLFGHHGPVSILLTILFVQKLLGGV